MDTRRGFSLSDGRETDEHQARTAAVRTQLVRDLYERSRLAVLTLLLLLLVIRWAMAAAYRADGRVRTLFALLVGVNLVRWLLAIIPTPRRDALVGVRAQYLAFAAGVLLTSATLGAMIVLAWPLLDTAHLAILAVITSGLVSGAVMSLGFNTAVYMLYMVPAVGALFLMAVTDHRPSWGADILATSFAIYALAVLAISLDQARTRRRAVELSLQLSDLVLHDSLTRLHNRRFLQEFMLVEGARLAREATDIEQGRSTEHDAAVGIYMVDLDHFKDVNDAYGHDAGDEVLRQMAEALVSAIRRSDILVRWGGEEFVVVARIKHRDHARIVAENLRRRIDTTEFRLPGGALLHKTCSLGFCVLPFFPDRPRQLTWEQGLGLADAALYLAKEEGRNSWVGAGCGVAPWDDTPAAFVEVLHDLAGAGNRGAVVLDRGLASS